MQEGDTVAHARALLLAARCPACAEVLNARALFGSAACPRCDSQVDPHLGGGLVADLRAQGRRRLVVLALIVGVGHLVLGWVPLISALLLVFAAMWTRMEILQPATVMLAPRRRVVTRWTARLLMSAALALTVIVIELLSLVPFIGVPIKALIGVTEVMLAAWAVSRYAHWQLERESQLRDVARWEHVVLGLCLAVLLACVAAAAGVLMAMAALFSIMQGWLT